MLLNSRGFLWSDLVPLRNTSISKGVEMETEITHRLHVSQTLTMCSQTWGFIRPVRPTPCVSNAWLRCASGLIFKHSTALEIREEVTSHHWAVCTYKRSRKSEGSCCHEIWGTLDKWYHLKGNQTVERRWRHLVVRMPHGCEDIQFTPAKRTFNTQWQNSNKREISILFHILIAEEEKGQPVKDMLEIPEQRSEDEQKPVASAATSCWNFWCRWEGYTIM